MIHFCMVFWTDGHENSTRERNVKLTWPYLKDMTKWLTSQQVPATATLYDYSPEKIIEDAVHIPYPIGVYKRAEKLNNIINNLPTQDFVCLMDSDVFIDHLEWPSLKNLIQRLTPDVGFFFNFAKLDTIQSVTSLTDIPKHTPYQLAFIKGSQGGFGGFQLTSVKSIKEIGGFDLKFTTWGGEDGELMNKFCGRGFIRVGIMEEELLPRHLPHFEDRENILYFNREEYIKNNY